MNQVTRHRQAHLVWTQRVVRTWRHVGRQRIAIGSMFFTDRFRRCPARVRRLGRNARIGNRRTPTLTTNTQWVGVNHIAALRVVIHTVFSEVDHDTLARARRQDVTRRQDDLRTFARQPWINTRIGHNHFKITQIIGYAQVSEGVFILGLDYPNLANHIFTRRWQWQLKGISRRYRKYSGKRQATSDGKGTRQHPEIPDENGW